MHSNIAIFFLINLVLFGLVTPNPQNYYHYRINRNIDRVSPYLRTSIRPTWKRNSQYPGYYDGDSYSQFNPRRSDNGTFKILNIRSTSREQSDIIFPGQNYEPAPVNTAPVPTLGNKSPCGNPFCEEVPSYPTEYIDQILRNSVVNFSEYLPKDDNPVEVGQRVNAPNEESLCMSYTDVYRPKSAENKNGKWLYIVNQAEYIQEIQMEVCMGTEEKCKFSDSFPEGYEAVCKQKHVYRTLYALDENSQRIVKESFKLPSCCSCIVRFKDDIASRSAFPVDSSKASTTNFNPNKKPSSPNRRTRGIERNKNN